MSKNICNVCNKEFEDKYFDKKQNKCILHCEKDDWFKHNNFNEKDEKIFISIFGCVNNWKLSSERIDLFWNTLNKTLKENIENNFLRFTLENINFPAMGVNKSYTEVELYKIKYLELKDCTFLDIIDMSDFFSVQNLKINDCKFKENVFFKEKILKEQFFFQNNEVFKNIDFFNMEFNGTCSFTNNKFKNELTFNYIIFNDLVIFNNSEIEDLFFQNTFFRKESNFLDIKLSKVGSRETARIIKDSFEKQNNIIESNKFYTLEMKEREKELSPKKDFFEWLVFKIHAISSNHSQDWTLALFWIINLTFFYSYLNTQPNDKILVFKIIFSCIAISVIACMTIKIPENLERRWLTTIPTTIVCYGFYGYLVETDWQLSEFSKNLNPFSIMRGDEPITLGTLIFKIIIAYLIYQLIISIRQNTRRK
ncbi:hypothetical protein [Aliarcobacter butzleri]|uniref:hypothetical protein n=1 Tax=Aliarcobacter butzleri TaxID=28197 RepID=UPI00063AAE9F|nr:hypothetical protein [Aliarcobacter butzleri]KLE10177.1 hypothetical protein AF79_04075 [Aliarcobacter butzleri L354]MCG3694649.1 hypothetical protein [Aliarcobacter butzleri]MDN5130589.1 hypothetical protein [Aliarcobacter butzleri]